MLMCARCAYAYHCKVPAQLPSPGGNVACPEDGVKASKTQDVHLVKLSFNPTNCAVWMASGAGGLQKEMSQFGWRKTTFVLGFQAQQDSVFSCAFYFAIRVFKSSARQQLKKVLPA